MIQDTIIQKRYVASLLAVLMVFLTGCASSSILPDDVPEGANRIIMEREEMTEGLDADAPALAFFVDARQHLRENGFTLAEDDEEELLLTTEPMQVDDDLALRIQVHARPAPGGSEVYISSNWAPTTTAAPNAWQAAHWTDGMPREAFGETYTIMYNLAHSDLLFGVQ